MKNELLKQINILVDRLHELRELHEQLLASVHAKLRAMRNGDINSLNSWSARENFLIRQIEEAEKQRRGQSLVLSKALDLDEKVTLTQMANHLDEPHRSKLLALAGAIRGVVEQIYQINHVNDAVTREILNCFAQMQRQIKSTHCDIGLYDPNGRKQMGSTINILDAVG